MKTKSKWSGAAFLMLALALVAGLALVAAPAPPAAAEDLAWSSVEGDFPLHGLPPGVGQIIDVDVSGNTVFVLADATAGDNAVETYRSDDDGYRWEAPNVLAAPVGVPSGAEVGVAIAISPNYTSDGTVHVLITDPTGPAAWVLTSTDKGVTWPFATGNVPAGTVPAPTTAAALAVSPVFNALQSGGQIVIGGTFDAASPTDCVWVETWNGPTVGWSGAWTAVPNVTLNLNCLAVEYAPTSSLRLVGVFWDPATAAIYGASGSIAIGFPPVAVGLPGTWPADANAGSLVIHTTLAGAAWGAVIALPDDYNPIATAACPNCPMYFFVGTWGEPWSGAPGTQSSTFWFNTSTNVFDDLKAASTLPGAHYETSGLVADGTYSRATLIAGCYGVPITYNCDVRSLSWGSPVFIEGNGGPIGTASTTVGVLLAYTGSGNTVYAATTDFAAPFFVPGDLCCVSRSDDFAASWSDTCLTSEGFVANVNDMVWLDGLTGIVVCNDGVGPWESTFKTWDKGLSWKRVDRWQDVTAVAAAPDGTIALLDTGTTGNKVLLSTDNGETFTPTAADPPTLVTQQMSAIAAGSATDIFVGDITGHIYVSNDGGATWDDKGALGAQIYSLEVPDGYADAPYVAAGMVSTTGMMEILVSSDAGASWAQWGSGSTQAAGWGAGGIYIGAEFSPSFDGTADSLLYAHTVLAGFDDVYRADLSATTEVWQRLSGANVPIAAVDLVHVDALDGVASMNGNILFATVFAPGAGAGAVMSTFYPETVSAVAPYVLLWRTNVVADVGSDWILGVLDAVAGSSVDVFCVDTAAAPDLVRAWTETTAFLTPPVLSSPADGSIVPSNNTATGEPCEFQWMPVLGAMQYEVGVATDPALAMQAVTDSAGINWLANPAPVPSTQASMPVGSLTDGETYYFRVRVSGILPAVAGVPTLHTGPWSDWYSFTVEAVEMHRAPELISPESGATDAGIRPLFKWSGIEDATGYTLQVTTEGDTGYASPVIDESLGVQQTYQPAADLDYDATYRWRVQGTGADWTSPWNESIFTTIPTWAELAPAATPAWIWVIIAIGAILAIAVIVLIVRTRRAV